MLTKLFGKSPATPKRTNPIPAGMRPKEMETRLLILALKNGQPVRRPS